MPHPLRSDLQQYETDQQGHSSMAMESAASTMILTVTSILYCFAGLTVIEQYVTFHFPDMAPGKNTLHIISCLLFLQIFGRM